LLVVTNGKQAVETWQTEKFDVVLMDCQMPEMDDLRPPARFAKLEGERARSGTNRRTPIVALTANAVKGDRERCLAAGWMGYITKPIMADSLFGRDGQSDGRRGAGKTGGGELHVPAPAGQRGETPKPLPASDKPNGI